MCLHVLLLRGATPQRARFCAQLSEILSRNGVRVMNLFREWDEDSSGYVDKKEFRKAMPLLGLEVSKKEIDALFDSWDPDKSGKLEFKELDKILRRGNTMAIDDKLKAGGAGKIEMDSKARTALRRGTRLTTL